MSSFVGEEDRKIVPRWRVSRNSISDFSRQLERLNGEVSPSLQANLEDWQREGTLWTALDAVAGAIVENRLDLVGDALHRIRTDVQAPPAALEIIAESEGEGEPEDQYGLTAKFRVDEGSRRQIQISRARLAEYPYDPIEWTDLARSFTTLGLLEKAHRCISVAQSLAPSDVFVLRAASFFYIQQGDPDQAQWILTKNARTVRNPWLMSSEIAAASVAGRESKFLKIAMKLEQGDFRDSDLTELRAALATAELDAGSQNRGKKLLRRSLEGANENSLAQIQWMDRTRLGGIIDTSNTRPPHGHEAGAYRAFFNGDWAKSAAKSLLWFYDQPFSANAGIFSSFILSDMAGQPGEALAILDIAIRANADNVILKNNQAFAYIQLGKYEDATRILNGLSKSGTDPDYATVDATRGLLCFRQGLVEEGRSLYRKAIEVFQKQGNAEMAGRAATFLALEEVTSRTEEALDSVKQAILLTKDTERGDVTEKLNQIENKIRDWFASDN